MFEENMKAAYALMTPTEAQKRSMLEHICEAGGEHGSAARRGFGGKRPLIFPMAAVIVLALCTAVAASGVLQRYVDWHGDTVELPFVALSTPRPVPSGEDAEREAYIGRLLQTCGENELMAVKYTDEDGVTHTNSTGLSETLDSVEALRARLADAGSPLEAPWEAPAGFALVDAQVDYACAAGYEYILTETSEEAYGLTAERYAIPEEGMLIRGYWLLYDGDGGKLAFHGELIDGEAVFIVGEDENVRRVSVDGMDDALVMENDGGPSVEMRKTLDTPIPYAWTAPLFGAFPAEDGNAFTEASYHVSAAGLDADALLVLLND